MRERMSRRGALRGAAGAGALALLGGARGGLVERSAVLSGQDVGERPARSGGVEVLNPRGRVPISLIIDDSTCLVNLAHFAIPQFAEVFPGDYKQPWQALPREIPDAFVARFAAWCEAHGVRGKYSIVPYPACVGWVDRDMPGWSRGALLDSLKLVREVMLPAWDIHPEMVTHTWGIDLKTGRPFEGRTEAFMENWGFSQTKSADEMAEYLAYALRILRNVGLPCEGVTTPGGFGSQNRLNLAVGVGDAVREVFPGCVPHYFRDLFTDGTSVAPRVELAAGLGGADPRCVVSVVGCTGDWFGGWDGLELGHPDQFISADGRTGRLPEVIARGEPAVLVGHWPGFYCNGTEHGFQVFQEVVKRLEGSFDNLVWMKVSEIAAYWAARELTALEVVPSEDQPLGVRMRAPFGAKAFTVRVKKRFEAPPRLRTSDGGLRRLAECAGPGGLVANSWCSVDDGEGLLICFDLPAGDSQLDFAAV